MLQNNEIPSKPKQYYFNSIFFYEPLLTNEPLFGEMTPRYSFSQTKFIHPFKFYFPNKYLYYFPKIIVVQSGKPYFWLMTKLLSVLFKLIFQPYIRGQSPIKIQPRLLQVIQNYEPMSVIREKEFLLSYVFSFRLPEESRFDIQLILKKMKWQISAYKDESMCLTEEMWDLLVDFLSSEQKLWKLVLIFHCVILERQIYIIHAKPGAFYNLIQAIIFP